MKKQKIAPQALATGVFKKRKWPWLFILAAIIVPVVTFAMITVEFFFFKRCNDCSSLYAYTFHYEDLLNTVWLVVAILVALAILCAILFVRKRSLTLTATQLIYKKGRKTINIELSSIESIDTGAKSIKVKVPFKKFRFAKLKNKKEFYDALNAQLQAPTIVVTTPSTTAHVSTSVSLPTTAEGKIRYFQSLLAAKVITPEQYEKYTNTVLANNFPTLY